MVTCLFDGGCNRPRVSKGLCHTHYEQRRKGRELTPIRKRGFAGLDRASRREVATKGGLAAQQKGTAYRWTSEQATRAGIIAAGRRHGWSPERIAAALQERGL